jgi:hypothetical protein
MANLQNALHQLREERSRAERQIETLDKAISAVEGVLGGSAGPARNGTRTGRVMSPAARRRIAAAQRARWARVRQQSSAGRKTSAPGKKRALSAASRRKIADAQRARWARFRSKQEKAAA